MASIAAIPLFNFSQSDEVRRESLSTCSTEAGRRDRSHREAGTALGGHNSLFIAPDQFLNRQKNNKAYTNVERPTI
ncbi:hypothetical protein [Rhodoblastus sp.]|uniref:hypothetical protein n=1 Tax=Rhodoblastus sp. TaxID=1962975 RepID=UPI003F991E6F